MSLVPSCRSRPMVTSWISSILSLPASFGCWRDSPGTSTTSVILSSVNIGTKKLLQASNFRQPASSCQFHIARVLLVEQRVLIAQKCVIITVVFHSFASSCVLASCVKHVQLTSQTSTACPITITKRHTWKLFSHALTLRYTCLLYNVYRPNWISTFNFSMSVKTKMACWGKKLNEGSKVRQDRDCLN